MRQQQQMHNDRTIDKSVDWLIKSQYETSLNGYMNFMKAALQYLIEVHAPDELHINEDRTLACGIVHDGTIVKIWGHDGPLTVNCKKATERLLDIVPMLPKKGWVGVLLSGMEGWYNVEKEMGYLTDTATWGAQSFTRYFKPV